LKFTYFLHICFNPKNLLAFGLIFLLLSFSENSFGQIKSTVSYKHYNTTDGLPSTQVQGIFEDSKGFIWAITDRGAARFNGYSFQNFTTHNGLVNNNVLLINEDNNGRIWFMCANGDYCYLMNDTIISYKGNSKIKSLLKDKLPGPFYFDDRDTMWVTTFSGVQLFKCYGDSVSEFKPNTSSLTQQPTYYLRKVHDKLVALQIGEVTANNTIHTTDNINYLLEVAGECKLACSVQVSPEQWALAGPGGYVVFNENGNVLAHFNTSPYIFSTLEHDRKGQLWMTNSNGAYLIEDYLTGPDVSKVYFDGHFISAMLQDKNGNYWFGDRDNGLFFVPSLDIDIFKEERTTKQNKIVSIQKKGDQIFYSDASGRVFEHLGKEALAINQLQVPSAVTLDFVPTNKGNFIVGNKPYLISKNSSSFKAITTASTIRRSTNLRNGECAFALADGLAFLDQNEVWREVDRKIYKERSNVVYEDQQQVLWIGSNSGLYKWQQDSAISITAVNSTKPRILDLAEWKDQLVIGTRNNGLLFYSQQGVVILNEESGLLSNTVDCICVEDDAHLWIGTASGLQCLTIESLTPLKFTSYIFNSDKGLPSNEVNDIALYEENLYVATNDGLAVMHKPSSFSQNPMARVYLEGISIGNKNIPLSDNILLTYDQNNIQFQFLSLNYRTGNHTRYRYRLVGLHDEWQITMNTSADYWALKPAEYKFEVSSMNEDGVWSESKIVSIHIKPHFTNTWWFRILLATVLLSIAAAIILFVYRSKKKQLLNKLKMAELKQQALNANMNPHFIFNSLNSIQHFINTSRSMEANDYLIDFSKLIRMNLETNQHNEVSLEDELDRLELYLKLEKLRFGDKLQYQIDIRDGLNAYDLYIPPMLLQPYVENAIIHGILPGEGKGNVTITALKSGNSYRVNIQDDGIGIHKSLKLKTTGHQSLAMKMNKERMALLAEQTGELYSIEVTDLSDVLPNVHGTLVRVELPLGN
jgi:ligand-binding sensor domain-containing protein